MSANANPMKTMASFQSASREFGIADAHDLPFTLLAEYLPLEELIRCILPS